MIYGQRRLHSLTPIPQKMQKKILWHAEQFFFCKKDGHHDRIPTDPIIVNVVCWAPLVPFL